MTPGIITSIVVSLASTAYLIWKFKTAGFADAFTKSAKGPFESIMLLFIYLGISVGLIGFFGIVRIIANIYLFCHVIGGPVWPNTVVGLAVIVGTMLSTIWAYRTGLFAKPRR
jgi:hypothetical protein